MDTQMQFDFMSDGPVNSPQRTEPTTGNEIPPGSSAEEVKDEVDAKLSVGEYVVPADVVQYFGVAYFEKLRDKAKKAMGEMDQGGRINGGAPQDDLPFSDDELNVEDDGADEPSFAEGGMVGSTMGGNETKTYVGPNGQEIQIQFVNGQPVQQIPPGFVLKAGQTSGMRTEVDEGERPQNTIQQEVKPMNEWAPEDFEKFANQENVLKGFGALGMLLGPGGALIGRGAMEGYRHSARKALEEIDTRLADSNLDQANKERLQQIRGQLEETASGGLFGRMGDSMRSGNGLLGGLLPEGGLMGKMFGRGQPAAATRTPTASTPTTNSGGSSAGLASRSTAPTSRAPTQSSAPPSRPSSPQSTPSPNRDAGQGFDRGTGLGVGPMAEGGLIKKRK
jgi:hypothetical protein